MRKVLSEEKQKDILYTMKKSIDNIRSTRIITGLEHNRLLELWQEIDNMYNKLDYKHQEEFNNYVN